MNIVTTGTTEMVTADPNVTEFVTVVAVADPNVTTETTEVVTVDVSSGGSGADKMTEFVTADPNVTEFVTVVAVPDLNVTTETTEVMTVDVGSSDSGADNVTEFVTVVAVAEQNDQRNENMMNIVTTETTEMVAVDVRSDGSVETKVTEFVTVDSVKASAIVKRKINVMSAREMMRYFQLNQKAVTSLNRRKKSVSESQQGTSARGLIKKEDQAPRLKIPTSRKKKNTTINAKRVQGGSNWGLENEKLTFSSSSSNEGSSKGSRRGDKREGRGTEAHMVSTESANNITGDLIIKTDEEIARRGNEDQP